MLKDIANADTLWIADIIVGSSDTLLLTFC